MTENTSTWDTKLLIEHISQSCYTDLGKIDGSFACIHLNNEYGFRAFRNELVPLFVNYETGEISSVKTDLTPDSLPPNAVLNWELENYGVVDIFETKEMPYFILDTDDE